MRKPRKGPPGKTYAISCTDEQWAAIVDGAARAGMKVSPWFVQCALTVDPWPRKHRRLVLDERQQRQVARAVAACARDLDAEEAGLADHLGALLEARLRGMARTGRREAALDLLRRAFGEEAAQTVAAAFMPDPQADAPAASAKKPEREATDAVTESPPGDAAEAPPGSDQFEMSL